MPGRPGPNDRAGSQKSTVPLNFVEKERLNQLSETGRHQGVIAWAAAYSCGSV